jgi:hypothetical protein
MRKITFNFKKVCIFAAVFAMAFTSCDKNEMSDAIGLDVASENINILKASSSQNAVEQRFEMAKKLAVFHSDGLKYAFEKLSYIQMEHSQTNYLQNISREERITLFSNIATNYLNQNSVAISEYADIFKLSDEFNSKLVDYYDKIMLNILYEFKNHMSVEKVETAFENILKSNDFASFSETEQNRIILSFAIFLDSFHYWNYNYAKWNQAFGGEKVIIEDGPIIPVGTDGFRIPTWVGRIIYIALTDSREGTLGIVAGAAGGAAGGAVVGALAGAGAGAGPGAGIGAIGGGVSGGVVNAIIGSVHACSIVMYNGSTSGQGNNNLDIYGNQYPAYLDNDSDLFKY